jgi:hypothetical protein
MALSDDVCGGNQYPTRNEIDMSKTERGHLEYDVLDVADGEILIADFGVNWRHIKQRTLKEKRLGEWLKFFEGERSYALEIYGYSDCIGGEMNNLRLRRGRAQVVHRLLGPVARSHVTFVGEAPADTYVSGNDTVRGRAHNRSVLLRFRKWKEFERDVVVETMTTEQAASRALAAMRRGIAWATPGLEAGAGGMQCVLRRLSHHPTGDDTWFALAELQRDLIEGRINSEKPLTLAALKEVRGPERRERQEALIRAALEKASTRHFAKSLVQVVDKAKRDNPDEAYIDEAIIRYLEEVLGQFDKAVDVITSMKSSGSKAGIPEGMHFIIWWVNRQRGTGPNIYGITGPNIYKWWRECIY